MRSPVNQHCRLPDYSSHEGGFPSGSHLICGYPGTLPIPNHIHQASGSDAVDLVADAASGPASPDYPPTRPDEQTLAPLPDCGAPVPSRSSAHSPIRDWTTLDGIDADVPFDVAESVAGAAPSTTFLPYSYVRAEYPRGPIW